MLFGLVKTGQRPCAQSRMRDSEFGGPTARGLGISSAKGLGFLQESQGNHGRVLIMSNVTTLCLTMVENLLEEIGFK